jgi:dihydrofolate synthase/folylpolyglutamate synthase
VVLDVAHNPQAAGVLADNLGSMAFHPETWAVFGMLADKDVAGVVGGSCGAGRPLAAGRAAGAARHGRRRRWPRRCARDQGLPVAGCFASPAEAYRCGAGERRAEDDRIVAFGSFLTVSGAAAQAAGAMFGGKRGTT